jgi:tetratricopeptide (TPR) repeat protein
MNYKSLYQILFIANEYAAINQNYSLIQRFLIKSHRFIESQKEKPDSQIFYKLHVLYYLANFSLRNKAFAESIDYLMQMEVLFDNKQQYKSVLYARQQLLFALNYFYIGNPEKGLGYVEDALADLPKHGSQTDIEDLMLTKAMFLTQLNDDESLSIMAKLTHTDAWYEKKLGMLWSIRKNLMEILMQIQFGNVELSLSRIKSFKRRYKKYLNQVNEQRVLNFVALVEKFLAKPDVIYQQTFQSTVYKMLEIEENRDIFNISFIAWLVSRWEKTIPYKITIRIIQGLSEVSPTKMT